MNKEITFVAIPSGDHECFCWDVTEEEHDKIQSITGYDLMKGKSFFNEGLFRIDPNFGVPDAYDLGSDTALHVHIKVTYEDKRRTFIMVTEPVEEIVADSRIL